ncbi:MAG: hypothetical protein EXR72_17740 [Myxococcales bacterium]|nr:hypothetical protein [Myxococcales bacterium]
MQADPGSWQLVYFDDVALIYLRAGDQRLPPFRWLDPARLSLLPDLRAADLAAAVAELARQTERCPDDLRTLLARAALAIARGDEADFAAAQAAIQSQAGETVEMALLAGRHAMMRRDPARAIALFTRFRELGGDLLLSALLEAEARIAVGDEAGAGDLLDVSAALPGGSAPAAAARARLFPAAGGGGRPATIVPKDGR